MTETLSASSPDPTIFFNVVLSLTLLAVLFMNWRQLGKKDKGNATSPVHVKMEDHFVTRREFDNLVGNHKEDMAKLEGLINQIFSKMEERDLRLNQAVAAVADAATEGIKEVAQAAYIGRSRIHDKLNTTCERVAVVESQAKHCPRTSNCNH